MARHPDLKIRWSRSLEKCRANNANPATIRCFYDIYEEVVKEFNILKENIYNMDEKRIQLGVGKQVASIIDCDQKEVYNIEDGNRELVTVIETVCADGSALAPLVIFKGARINSEWGCTNPSNARYIYLLHIVKSCTKFYLSIQVLPNGWTDQELGTLWLKKDFKPMSSAHNVSGGYRLLILDGHNSHCTYQFCSFAEKNKIIILSISHYSCSPIL